MDEGHERRLLIGTRESFVGSGLLLGAAAAIVVLAILGRIDPETIVLLTMALIGGVVALLGWKRAARVATAMAAVEEASGEQLEDARDSLEAKLDDAQQELQREQQRLERVEAVREVEQEWTRRLRQQIAKLQEERGALGNTSDIRELVLKIAIDLLDAEKGMLLDREDHDDDGKLDVVCSEGFEHDPEDSEVAQRFATEVLERDETIRENDALRYSKTEADKEIRNLVAIPIYMQDRFSGVVIGCNKEGGFEEYDDEVLLALGDHAGAVLQNSRLHEDLRTSYLTTVAMLADAIEAKDPFVRGHGDDVSRYVSAVATELGFDAKRREELVFAALLHDVGKIGISERILLKPAALTPQERSVIELHPRIGYRLVEQVPVLTTISLAILHHHERWDGDGYPSGLAGEDIPLEARIVTVADAYSAMTSERPYRGRMSVEEALGELRRCAGSQFDPEIVRLFVAQVEADPPESTEARMLADALQDPEFEVVRAANEPLLGAGSFAATDNLTFLYSHRTFFELARAEGELATVQRRPFAVLMVELTEIAGINRDEGYRAGDEAIQAVARAVQKVGGKVGGTAARFSGRRIAMLAPGADGTAAEQLGEEITRELDGGPSVRIQSAVSRAGEPGEDVVMRARLGLAPVSA